MIRVRTEGAPRATEFLAELAASTPSWEGAACIPLPDNAMYPKRDKGPKSIATFRDDIEAAQRVCKSCPLRIQCLTYAVEQEERWGVWGGYYMEYRTHRRAARAEVAALEERVAA